MLANSMTSVAIDNMLVFDAAAYAHSESRPRRRIGDNGTPSRPSGRCKESFLELLHTLLVYDRVELGYGPSALSMFDPSVQSFLWDLMVAAREVILPVCGENDVFGYDWGTPSRDFDLRPVLDFVTRSVDADIERGLRMLTLPAQYGASTEFYSAYITNECSAPEEMVTPLMFAARGVAYIATVLDSNTFDEHPFRRAYLAAPARLEAVKPFLTASALRQQKRLRTGYLALIESLPALPATGFDFSILKPGPATHLLTPLSSALFGQSPGDAIKTVMRLRSSDEGEQLRQKWRKEICSDPAAALVGHARQSVANCDVAGDVIQTVHVHSAARNWED